MQIIKLLKLLYDISAVRLVVELFEDQYTLVNGDLKDREKYIR